LRVGSGPYAWVDLDDKYTPFGHLPASVRGVEAHLLGLAGTERIVTPTEGQRDELAFSGDLSLDESGDAHVLLEQRFSGRYGSVLRKGLSEVEERRLKDVIETKILAGNLRGARLAEFELADRDDLDKPLLLRMTAEVPAFASRQGKELRIAPPFAPRLGQYATLPTRQTPILLSTDQDLSVSMKIHLPPGARVELPESSLLRDGEYRVEVRDRMVGEDLVLERVLRLPAGRIPVADYERFAQFTRAADAALNRDIIVHLP
jgi:cellulose synthase operon protein C